MPVMVKGISKMNNGNLAEIMVNQGYSPNIITILNLSYGLKLKDLKYLKDFYEIQIRNKKYLG